MENRTPPFSSKMKKKASSDNNIPKRMENGYPPPVVSHQLEEVLSVAMFNDREKSLPGKITTQDFASTVEVLKPAKGKFIREVKCGTFNVQVETTENVFYKTGAQFLTKRQRPTCHQHCSIQQVWRASKSRRRFSKYRSVWAEDRVPSTQVREMSRSEVPSMNISIVGKEIVVKYVSKEQNISINVSHPKSIGKSAKRSRGSLNHTTNEPRESPSQPGINLVEKQRPGNQNQNSEALPDAPCSVNTDQKKNSDTVVASLSSPPRRETKKASTPPSAPSDSEERDSDTSQQKVLQITQDKPLGQHCLTADTCLPPSSETLRTTSLSNGDLSKMSFEGSRDVDEERKSSSDVRENITSESQVPLCTAGTNGPLSAMGGMLPVQDASESEFCPLSCLTLLLLGEKAESIGCRGDRTLPGEGYESSNSISSVSEEATKASPLLSPSHWGTRCSKPGETPGSTFSCSQYIEFETEQEKVHYRDINKAILHGNSSANTQPLERKTPRSPAVRTASCSSLVSKSSRRGDIRSSVEWDQTEGHAHHVGRAGLSRTEVPASAFLTDELEQRLTTQNYKEGAVDSNSPVAIRNPGELTSYLENVEDDTCHATAVVENACHQDFEDLTSENQNEIGSQMKFAQNTTESACVGHTTEKLFLLDKTLTSDEDPTRNGDRDICGLSNFRQELAECQRTVSTVHPEESGNERTFTEASYHPVDIPLSPQKQKALKDQNLEINNPRKLSQELALRGGRASDGSQEEAIDQWARRRQQFKDGKRCSSAGGSSVISNFTEGSVTSDDAPSVDFGFRGVDIEEKGFYTENFHSMAWVFRGDDGNPEDSPRCLSKKPRPVAVRERTVRLFKGTGDYPWGFRIQFSKPIVVTEVDTNSAAEEAGLQIGDVVLSVNGTEVTSVEHAEAVHLAKKGPDILTMVVGSDISRCPNTPWPTCRGYLHKRTHSGFVKGWRKRWFVLKHDGFLLYYKHRKDEGKWPPVDVIKLEGAEVDIDNSLGKPFVFNCMPQSGSRTFCLCATSNQEMKR